MKFRCFLGQHLSTAWRLRDPSRLARHPIGRHDRSRDVRAVDAITCDDRRSCPVHPLDWDGQPGHHTDAGAVADATARLPNALSMGRPREADKGLEPPDPIITSASGVLTAPRDSSRSARHPEDASWTPRSSLPQGGHVIRVRPPCRGDGRTATVAQMRLSATRCDRRRRTHLEPRQAPRATTPKPPPSRRPRPPPRGPGHDRAAPRGIGRNAARQPRGQPRGRGNRITQLDAVVLCLLDQETQVVRASQLAAGDDDGRLQRLLDRLLGMEPEHRIGDPAALVQDHQRVEILASLTRQRARELELRTGRRHAPPPARSRPRSP